MHALRDIERDVGSQSQVLQDRLFLHDGHPSLEVGWRDVGDQSGLESVTQSLFELWDFARHLVRGEHDLMAVAVQGVEGVEKLFLGTFAARQELHVVKYKCIDAPEFVAKLIHLVPAQRADELVHENLGRHEQNLARALAGIVDMMPGRVDQVGYCLTHSTTNRYLERVVTGATRERQRGSISVLICRQEDDLSELVAEF